MSDMKPVIVPKSDQLNSDDLISGPMTIKVTGVTIKSGEQPVSIHFEGDNGKPYKCCKSMARVLVSAWGADSKQYVGRSMTLYRDPTVKWAGMEVGGIRISHLSHLDENMTMALTMTRSNRKPFTVRPLPSGATTNAAPQSSTELSSSAASQEAVVQGDIAGAATLTAQHKGEILALLEMANINVNRLLVASKVKSLDDIPDADFKRCLQWIDKASKSNKQEA